MAGQVGRVRELLGAHLTLVRLLRVQDGGGVAPHVVDVTASIGVERANI